MKNPPQILPKREQKSSSSVGAVVAWGWGPGGLLQVPGGESGAGHRQEASVSGDFIYGGLSSLWFLFAQCLGSLTALCTHSRPHPVCSAFLVPSPSLGLCF